jgi:hypothetical protein
MVPNTRRTIHSQKSAGKKPGTAYLIASLDGIACHRDKHRNRYPFPLFAILTFESKRRAGPTFLVVVEPSETVKPCTHPQIHTHIFYQIMMKRWMFTALACLPCWTGLATAAPMSSLRHRKLGDTPENAIEGQWIVELEDAVKENDGFQKMLYAVQSIPGASVYQLYSNVFYGFAVKNVPEFFLNSLLMNPLVKTVTQVSSLPLSEQKGTTYE